MTWAGFFGLFQSRCGRRVKNWTKIRTLQEKIGTFQNFLERTDSLASRLGISLRSLAPEMGLSVASLFGYRNGTIPISNKAWSKLERAEQTAGAPPEARPTVPHKRNSPTESARMIPVIGWAHAGHAATYEELPQDWREMIPTNCRDPKAFGVFLEGDSMEPVFREGDLLVLMPGMRIHNGCLAVVRLSNDGVLFRRVEVRDQQLRLVPLNPRYEVDVFDQTQISWAYPVWGSWRQIWH